MVGGGIGSLLRGGRDLSAILSDSDAPLGRLAADGFPLAKAIKGCLDVETLKAVIKRADTVEDHHWAIMAEVALLAITEDADVRELHVWRQIWTGNYSLADAAFSKLPPGLDPDNLNRAGHRIDLGLGRFEKADQKLRKLRDARAPEAELSHAQHVLALLDRGQFEAADEAARAFRTYYPDCLPLVSAHLRCKLVLEGPEAALAALDAVAHRYSATDQTAQRARFLMAAGRYIEALDEVLAQIDAAPRAAQLYPLLLEAGQQADRLGELTDTLERAAALVPGLGAIQEALAAIYIDQGEDDRAASLLARIQERNHWAYMALHVSQACQSEGPERARDAHEAALAVGVPRSAVSIFYALYLYYYRGKPDDIARAHEIVRSFRANNRADPGLISLHLKVLLALDRDGDAREVFEQLPTGLRKCFALAPFGPYFLARAGRDEEAAAEWPAILQASSHPSLNARSSYPEEVKVRFEGDTGDVLLFLTVFNGLEYLDWFLAYYRDLGVDHFFVVDNGSTDGTFERLLTAGDDVSVFRNDASFAASACGVFWANHLMRRYGVGHWCLHVDMDEALVFPGMGSGRRLGDFLRYLDAHDFGTVPGLMIDIYPDALETAPRKDLFASSRFIDTDYVFNRNELPPYVAVQGGVRARLTGRSLLMTKAPLVKMTGDLAYIANNHNHTHVPVADVSAALLHYKFIGDIRGRIDEAIDRGEHFMGARFYRALKTGLDSKAEGSGTTLRSANSVEYRDPNQLVSLGLLQTSRAWEQWS